MHCFRTGVEKGIKLCTAVQEGCGYKDTLRAHRYYAPLAKISLCALLISRPTYVCIHIYLYLYRIGGRRSTHMEQGERWSARRKTCHGVTLSTIHPADTGLESNPSIRGERPATSCISNWAVAVHERRRTSAWYSISLASREEEKEKEEEGEGEGGGRGGGEEEEVGGGGEEEVGGGGGEEEEEEEDDDDYTQLFVSLSAKLFCCCLSYRHDNSYGPDWLVQG